MVAGVSPSFTQKMISQVPVWDVVGVQVNEGLVCQAGAVTSGVQAVVPAIRWKSAYCRVFGLPPAAVTVQVMALPAVEYAGLAVVDRVRGGVVTCTGPGLA